MSINPAITASLKSLRSRLPKGTPREWAAMLRREIQARQEAVRQAEQAAANAKQKAKDLIYFAAILGDGRTF